MSPNRSRIADTAKNGLTVKSVSDELAPSLRKRGFRRKGLVWNQTRSGFVDVIEIQPSRWNDAFHKSFTLNFGVLSREVFQACWGRTAPTLVPEVECTVRSRVGVLAGAGQKDAKDLWWAVDGGASLATVTAEVREAIEKYGLPFFEDLHSLEHMERYLTESTRWETQTPLARIYLGIIRALVGDVSGARSVLASLDPNRDSAWLLRAKEAAMRVGIELSISNP
jgi:hypothetical protein